jgi:uncharacterized phage-like protein YoqJ
MIVGFTGHRKLGGYKVPNPTYTYVKQEIKKTLAEKFKKVDKIVTGMAIGSDQLAANIAIELGIPFIAAIPFAGQESKWPKFVQEEYRVLLKQADNVVIVSEGAYAPYKMQTRNEWIVNKSDAMIAIWTGQLSGGTFNCVTYAVKVKKPVFEINPDHA